MKRFVIRLRRISVIKDSIFEIVVMMSCSRRNGFLCDKIGIYSPKRHDYFFYINSFKLGRWLNRGALIRPSVVKLLSKFLISKAVVY
jgi:ribosomal protein S16